MERVEALVQKLNTQLSQKQPIATIRQTLLELLTELEDKNDFTIDQNGISILMPFQTSVNQLDIGGIPLSVGKPISGNETIQSDPNIRQKPNQLFLNELSNNANKVASIINETSSSQHETTSTPLQKEVMDHIALEPIKDLRAAIGINDKFLLIQNLFAGDEMAFEASIKTINAFHILAEAQFWIKKELKSKYHWEDESPIVVQFDQLVRRRFS